MKPWMIAALLGALFGLNSRRWLTVDVGHNQMFNHKVPEKDVTVTVTVIVGIGNTVNYNRLPPVSTLPSDKESSHAEGA
jgi:hypothetical protein